MSTSRIPGARRPRAADRLSFTGTGLYAWRRRPESRFGVLMVVLGFSWFLAALPAAEAPLIFTLGIPLGSIWPAVFIHMLLSTFPSGRLTTALSRRLTVAAYLLFTVGLVPALMAGDADNVARCVTPCPENVLQVADDDALTNVAKYAQAREARVSVRLMDGELVAEVADDGVGGADPRAGSGLLGLADRVETLGGRLRVDSPPGGGTRVRAEVPCLVPASDVG